MRRALVVGINNYPAAPLRGCINDAVAMAGLLAKNGDGSPDFKVVLLKDPPGKGALLEHIRRLFEGDECTCAVFYFSGHGYINDLGGYIVTPDARLHEEGISMDNILQLANQSAIKNKIIILDCCHSGAMGSPLNVGNTVAQLASGVTILTASKHTEKALEVNGHGIFTNLLLNALEGGAADLRGNITPGSIYAYIDQAMGPWGQRPVFKTNITQFVSLRTIIPPVPAEVLRMLIIYFPDADHLLALDPAYEYTAPLANPEKVAIFKHLQKMVSVGLIVPVYEEYMYWAAMNSGYCKLTALGHHYWRLVKDEII